MSSSTLVTQRPQVSDADILLDEHPIIHRILAARGVTDMQAMKMALQQLCRPSSLKGLDKAVALLTQALIEQRKILVIGDYDADGATSTALTLLAMRAMGCRQIDYLVPNRFEFGYGLTTEIVDVAKTMQPDLLVTVDNGIANVEGVAHAHSLGLQVLITDHHLPGEQLPDADAIVNPNLVGDAFESKCLAGVGVVFYVLSALRSHLIAMGYFQERGITPPQMAEYLDLVALGTVADVVPLDQNNRILVEQGLRRIRAGRCRPGISALLLVAKRNQKRIVASDMGFAVGPRLNAAGRLEDMALGIECLLAEHLDTAMKMAAELDELNQERRKIETTMRDDALFILEQMEDDALSDEKQLGICIYEGSWHQGVIGIVASRIKERYHRPTVVFSDDDDDYIKGSARSIPGVHIRDVLANMAVVSPGLMVKFGGHAMAAGMTINKARLAEFESLFHRFIAQQLDGKLPTRHIETDGALSSNDLNLAFAERLRFCLPWGQACPEPLFEGVFRIASQRIVGGKHLKLVLQQQGTEPLYDAMLFNHEERLPVSGWLNVVYRLDVNEFRNQQNLQLMIEHWDPQ